MRNVSSGTKLVSISVGTHRADVITARNKLVEEHIGLVRPIAQAILRGLPPSFSLDDLVSEGYLGLISAAVRFRTGKAPFETYAKQRIRGAILDSIRRSAYRDNTQLPLEAVLREEMSSGSDIELSLDQGRLTVRLNQAITILDEDARRMIHLKYGRDELKLGEIADILGIHRGHAWRIHRRALRELRPLLLRALLDPAA
jgi:RNA polymerase sigma factor (sigma-70 family)